MATVIARISTTVTRYKHELIVSLISQDVKANTSKISYAYTVRNTGNLAGGSWNFGGINFNATIDGTSDTENQAFDFRTQYTYTMVSGEKTITHGADGTKSFAISLHGDANPGSDFFLAASKSGTAKLPAIPRASSFTVTPNTVVVGDPVTISISRASTAFTHDITYESGTTTGTIATGVATSTTWTPPSALLGTKDRVPIEITVSTKSGATTIGSPVSRDIAMKVPPVYPEVGLGTPFDVRVRRVEVVSGKLTPKEVIPYLDVTTTDTMSASGSITITVSSKAYETSLDEAVVLADVFDGSQWLTGDAMLFVLSRTEDDDADLSETASYTGMSYVDWLLTKNVASAERQWKTTTVGDIIVQHINAAKNRGWGTYVTASFSASKTSVGTNWQNTDAPNVPRGTPASQILEGQVSDVLSEYRTHFDLAAGRAVLDMYNPGYGEDWTTSGADQIVNLQLAALGKVAGTAPVRKDAGGKLTRVYVNGDEANATREDDSAVNPIFGHLEGTANASGVKSPSRLRSLGDALLSTTSTASVERTFSYDLSSTQTSPHLFPYRTFRPGDWILIPADDGKATRARVSQVAITRDSEGTRATVTTGDLIPSGLAATARKISQASGGAISGGILRAPLGLSSAIPAAPVNVQTVIDGYWTPSGAPAAGVDVSWDAVTESLEGTALTVDLYEVWTREEEGAPYALAALSDDNTANISPLPINTSFDIKVRGRSDDGVYGEYSDPVSIVTVAPDEVLPAPAAPQLEVDALGTVGVTWTGTLGGTTPPAWFNYVQAEISDASNGAFSVAGQQLFSAGTIAVPNVGEGLWWFRLVGYDSLNGRGTPSPALSIQVSPLVVDTRKPNAPAGVTATSTGFWNGSQPASRIDVSWTAVTKAEDDTDIDVLVYEVWGKISTDTAYKWLGATDSTSVSVSPQTPVGATWDIQVFTTAINNERSAPSTTVQVVIDSPDMIMDPPSAPDTSSARGLIFVTWDGTLFDGVTAYVAPPFVSSVDIQVSTDNGATWGVYGFMSRGNMTQSVSGVTPGSSARVRLVARDSLGQESAPSAYDTITVAGTTLNGLDPEVSNAIDAAAQAAADAAAAASDAQQVAGAAVTDTYDEWAVSASNTVAPTTGWSTTTPAWTPGNYIWQRTTVTFGTGAPVTGSPVLLTGNTGPEGPEGPEGPQGLQGIQGPDGQQGIQGPPGDDGLPSYTHIAYADSATGTGFSQSPTGKEYMGIYVDSNPTDSSTPSLYAWSLIKGADGTQGVPGTPGTNGQTPYFHTAWADSADGATNFNTTTPGTRTYLGTYTDYTAADSVTPSTYAWSKIQGPTGPTGATGKGISSSVVTYQASSSGTVVPTGTWVSTVPAVADGQFLWTRTVITYSDATTSTSYSVGRMGVNGSNGTPGTDGTDGTNGQTSYLHVAYATNSTGTTGFSTTDPTGKTYMGTYSDFTVADSTNPALYSWVLIKGADGSDGSTGATGKGISSSAVTYQVASSGTVAPTGTWLSTVPSTPEGQFLWTRTIITFTDGASTTAYSVAKQGAQGLQGIQGPTGDQGIQGPIGPNGTPSYTHIAYADDSAGGGFSQLPAGKEYMGVYVDSTSTDSSTPSMYAWSLIKGADGAQGVPGAPGADGQTPYFHTAWSDAADGSVNFSTTVPGTRTYLGTYTDFVQADSSTASMYAWSKIQGPTGATGSTGAAGKGVSSAAVTYQASASGTTPPVSTWTSSVPAVSAGQYLWTRTITTYTDASTSTAYSVGRMGTNGSNGTPGTDGTDGQTSYLHVAYATNSTGTAGFSTTDPSGKTYMGTYSDFTLADSVTPGDYTWVLIKGADGSTGSTGPTGKGITSSTVTYQVGSSGTAAPGGSWVSTVPATPEGQFLWTRTVIVFSDGATTTAYSVAKQGPTGPTGATGKGISSAAITYQASSSGTVVPTGTWLSSVPSVPAGQFLWTRTITTYTDSTTSTAYSVGAMGTNGANGTPGAPGADGQTSYLHVAYATNSTGTTGFSTTDPSGKTYMGTYTDFTAADSSNPALYTWSLIKGADGSTGSTGPAGKGISSSVVTYQVNATSGTVAPTGTWLSTVPSTPDGQFLWTRTVITFTDAATTTTYSVAKQGAKGTTGNTGATGATGTSVTSVTRYYLLATTAPAKPTTSAPGGSWTTTEPDYTPGMLLYFSDRALLSNGSFVWSDVSLSSAYVAAAAAYQAAMVSQKTADGKNSVFVTAVAPPGGIEVGRNYFPDPATTTNSSLLYEVWPGTGNTSDGLTPAASAWSESGGELSTTYTSVTSPDVGDFRVRPSIGNGVMIPANEKWTFAMTVSRSTAGAFTAPAPNVTASTVYARSHTADVTVGADEPVRMWVTFSFTSAPASNAGALSTTIKGKTVGLTVSIADVDAYPGDYDPTRDYFNGSSLPSGGFTFTWAGTPNASDSIKLLGGPAPGDLWWALDAESVEPRITGVQMWNGQEWVNYAIVADSVFVPGSVGGTLIADGAITTDLIHAGAIEVSHLSNTFGQDLDISSNGSVTILAGQAASAQDAATAAAATVDAMRTRYDFTPTEAIISQPDSPFQVAISNEQMEFRDGGVARAWLNAGGFSAPILTTEQLLLTYQEISDAPEGSTGTVIKRR